MLQGYVKEKDKKSNVFLCRNKNNDYLCSLINVQNMKTNKDHYLERIQLTDEQLDEVVGGAQGATRPSWYRGS